MISGVFHVAFVGAVAIPHVQPPPAAASEIAFAVMEPAPVAPPPDAVVPPPPPVVPPPAPRRRMPHRPPTDEPPPIPTTAPPTAEPAEAPAGPVTDSPTFGASGPTLSDATGGLAVTAGTGGSGGNGRGAGRAGPPVPPPSGPSREEIARYLALVRRKIDERKEYPMAGRRLGVEGVVRLRIRIAADGRLVFDRVLSGDSPVLSDAARQAVHRAAPFPSFPRSFGTTPVELVVPLNFELTD